MTGQPPSDLIQTLDRVLGGREPAPLEAAHRAAVAVVLRPAAPSQTMVLLIERTQREDDPWSGQMAFPGGKVEPDERALAAALRETREEVGLDLATQARLIGVLDDLRAMARGRWLDLVIRPHVFELVDPGARLALQSEEVASTLWAGVEEMASGRLDDTFRWILDGVGAANLPCFRVEGKVVWGLTYRMLSSLFQVSGLMVR